MRTFFLLILLIFIIASCNSEKNNNVVEDKNSKEEIKRFFNDESFWNQPIPDDVEIDSRSDYWISLLDRDPSGENIGLNINSHTIPIYDVDSKQIPFQKVKQAINYVKDGKIHTHYKHEPEFDEVGVPIPDYMKPSPGGDSHVAIIDWSENKAWDMFFVKKTENGDWSSATGMIYPLNGPGVFNSSDFNVEPNRSIHGHGPGVAAGTPIIAGVIRYDEVKSGKIRHKLAGALRYVAFQEYVYPAIWTDGNFDGGIPEGATIQLDPDLNLTQFNLTEGELVVAKALQEYGFVIIDFSVGSTIRAEWLGWQKEKSWDGVLRGWKVKGGIKSIPVKYFRILKVNNIQTGGDRKKEYFLNYLYFEGDSLKK